MDCLYPVKTPGRSYRMGCRCQRCRDYVRRRDRGRGYYPRERVAQVIHDWMRQQNAGIGQLAFTTGIQERVLFRVLHGASEAELEHKHATGESVEFRTVDRLLCGIGWLHLFHLPPEDGGFADLYQRDYDLEAAA